jgi:hypothetical protein
MGAPTVRGLLGDGRLVSMCKAAAGRSAEGGGCRRDGSAPSITTRHRSWKDAEKNRPAEMPSVVGHLNRGLPLRLTTDD